MDNTNQHDFTDDDVVVGDDHDEDVDDSGNYDGYLDNNNNFINNYNSIAYCDYFKIDSWD